MGYVLPILSLAVVCGLWIVFQQWIARQMPGAPGIRRRCSGCTQDCTCDTGGCTSETDRRHGSRATIDEIA